MPTPPRSFLIGSPPPRARRPFAHVTRPLPEVDVRAIPAALGAPPRVTGAVVDAPTGAPLPGARVAIADPARRRAPRRAREVETDAAGRFSSPRPGRGPALLLARRDGYLPEIVPVAAGEVVVALARAGAIAGRLTRPDGAPLAGAHVDAVSRDAMDVGHALTGPDGSFVLSTLRPGRYLVAPEGAAATAPVCVVVRSGSAAHLALVAEDRDPAGNG